MDGAVIEMPCVLAIAVADRMGWEMIEFTILGVAPSTPNLREHHMARARRVKAQRAAVARKMPKWAEGPLLVARLTRVGPRALDTDNLAAALKGHRDAVAARLRVDDATPLMRWEYAQAKGEPAVVVQVWRSWHAAPPGVADSLRKPSTVKGKRKPGANYTPPRSTPVNAAKEAEAFAPPECACIGRHTAECVQRGAT